MAPKQLKMKERNFYNDEFDELIRQKTDQYKMYPSDRVWKGIYNSLHTRRRRFIIGMSFLITGILFFAGKELLVPAKHSVSVKKIADNSSDSKITTDLVSTSPVLPESKKENLFQRLSAASDDKLLTNQFIASATISDQQIVKNTDASVNSNKTLTNTIIISTPEHGTYIDNNFIENISVKNNSSITAPIVLINRSPVIPEIQNEPAKDGNAEDRKQINWLQEYAKQELTPLKKNKFNWQVYLSPTVNYRKLSGGNNYYNTKSNVQNVPIALTHFGNPNEYVDHKPAIGFEVGGSMLYRVTRNLTFKAGIQFNYSRYTIKAYSSTPEQATIALNSNYYGYFTDSITAYSSIRNFGGNARENLENQYFQLSVPVGLEMKIIGNGKLQLNIAGTIQPTYSLNRNSYLLTTDYTNYTKEPSLFRRWNVNGGVEAFVSYKIGSFRWQIGPQFRYQLFSTYTDKYPLKENLMEYGIKIGVSKTIR